MIIPFSPFRHPPSNTAPYRLFSTVYCSVVNLHISVIIRYKQREGKLEIRIEKHSSITQSCRYIFLYSFQQCLAKLPLISQLLLDKTFICLFTTLSATDITLNKLQLNMTFNVKLSTANTIVVVSRTTCSMTPFLMDVSCVSLFSSYSVFLAQTFYAANTEYLCFLHLNSKASWWCHFLHTTFSSSSAWQK